MPDSPFIEDVPAAQALAAWRAAREAAGCPDRLPAVTVPVAEAAGLVTAAPVWAVRSSPPFDAAGMDGIAVRAADTLGASETTPAWLSPEALRCRRPRRTAYRRSPVPARPIDRRGRQRG